MSYVDQHVMQFPPGVYDLKNASGTRIFRVLSLSSTVPSSDPPFAWVANREHWFSPTGSNLSTLLGGSLVEVGYTSDLGSLKAVADELATPSIYTFQTYALGVLSPSDWIHGVPGWASPAYYFENTTSKMRPLFEVSSTDATKLAYVNWFYPDNKLTSYFAGASPGAKITVNAKPTANIPTTYYYYRAP